MDGITHLLSERQKYSPKIHGLDERLEKQINRFRAFIKMNMKEIKIPGGLARNRTRVFSCRAF